MNEKFLENSWKLVIIRAQNGYILIKDGDDTDYASVIETNESYPIENYDLLEDGCKEGFFLLLEVMEYFGFGGSKHDKGRIKLFIEKRED